MPIHTYFTALALALARSRAFIDAVSSWGLSAIVSRRVARKKLVGHNKCPVVSKQIHFPMTMRRGCLACLDSS